MLILWNLHSVRIFLIMQIFYIIITTMMLLLRMLYTMIPSFLNRSLNIIVDRCYNGVHVSTSILLKCMYVRNDTVVSILAKLLGLCERVERKLQTFFLFRYFWRSFTRRIFVWQRVSVEWSKRTLLAKKRFWKKYEWIVWNRIQKHMFNLPDTHKEWGADR